MDAVTLSQVLELLKRTGKNADAAGTSTVFARLAQIASYVDTLESTLGTVNTNVSANATKLGTNTDAAGTSTVFARLAQIAGYVDTLEGSLGQTGDAASTTGSVHAKLATLLNSNAADLSQQTPKMAIIAATPGTNVSQTLLDIVGKGYLHSISFISSSFSNTFSLGLIMDGVTLSSESDPFSSIGSYQEAFEFNGLFRFNNSLKVTLKSTANYTLIVRIMYSLDK
jgi:hypothetical protein